MRACGEGSRLCGGQSVASHVTPLEVCTSCHLNHGPNTDCEKYEHNGTLYQKEISTCDHSDGSKWHCVSYSAIDNHGGWFKDAKSYKMEVC